MIIWLMECSKFNQSFASQSFFFFLKKKNDNNWDFKFELEQIQTILFIANLKSLWFIMNRSLLFIFQRIFDTIPHHCIYNMLFAYFHVFFILLIMLFGLFVLLLYYFMVIQVSHIENLSTVNMLSHYGFLLWLDYLDYMVALFICMLFWPTNKFMHWSVNVIAYL